MTDAGTYLGSSPSDGDAQNGAVDETAKAAVAVSAVVSKPLRDVVLAIDIGGTKFAAGLVTAKGELIDRARVEVERDVVPEAHFTALADMVTEMMER
ncbi:MAG: glucokinase, partial [Ilumatobacter sp.]